MEKNDCKKNLQNKQNQGLEGNSTNVSLKVTPSTVREKFFDKIPLQINIKKAEKP
jgi:hypothetical protein